jgi:DNA-binding MarR family transcriptional regulator
MVVELNNESEGVMKESMSQDEALRLWVLLGQTRDLVRNAIRKELEQFNVTSRQAAVLLLLQASTERLTPAEISRQLFREPHTISAILKRMEKQGWLTRQKDLNKKNLIRVALTEEGRELYLKTSNRKSIHKIFSCLSEEEVKQMSSCLDKLKRKGMREVGMKRDTFFSP